MTVRMLIGGFAALFSLTAYGPYLHDIFAGKTKPHIFSWFVWSILMWIAFAAQASELAGPGAWVTAAEAIACIAIFVISFARGEKEITLTDWMSLAGALCGIALWVSTENAFWAVVLVTVVDALGFYPTVRKAWKKPHEETAISFFIISSSFVLGFLALDSYTWTTALYPAYLALANGAFWLYLIARRRYVRI